MKVRVYAPPFCDHSRIDDLGFVELTGGASLNSLYKLLKVPLPLRPLLITSINYDSAGLSTVLCDGDEVSIFWPLSGG
jgi:molybdopterin converting factor small subunit